MTNQATLTPKTKPGQKGKRATLSPKAKADREEYVVLKPITRHGRPCLVNQVIEFAVKGSHTNRDRWLSQGKIRALADMRCKDEQPVPGSRERGADRFEMVVRGLVDPSRWNPRKDFESPAAVAALDELVESVREDGIIEPLIVRPKEDGRLELVAGERRWRAAGRAGLETVPCIVRDLDDVAAIRVQAIENLQRRDINPLEEAAGYELLMQKGKYTVADLVKKLGKSEASIYARLVLLKAPPGIRQALNEGRIPASTAELVARIDDSDLRLAAMDAILYAPPQVGEEANTTATGKSGSMLSFRQARQWIDHRRAEAAKEAEWQKAAKGSHAAATVGAKILSAEESGRVLYAGGYVMGRDYVKPTDHCPEDPKNRTYQQIAKDASRELPAAVIARDPKAGSPVVLLPRKEAEQIIADLVPDAAAQERRRKEADAQRKAERDQAELVRKQHAADLAAREQAVTASALFFWEQAPAEQLTRFLVRQTFEQRLLDSGTGEDRAAALNANGCPCTDDEAEDFDSAWLEEYLNGCDLEKLRRWQIYFALRNQYSETIEEEALDRAEALFGSGIKP